MYNGMAYFDYAATTFMPDEVINSMNEYNRTINVSPNRGGSILSSKANMAFECSREKIKSFFSCKEHDLIFYPGATYAINSIAYGIEHIIEPMDIIILGPYEHHSNYLPWRELAKRKGAIVFEMPVLDSGQINIEYLEQIKDRVKIVVYSSVANTNGYKIDASEMKSIFGDNVLYISDDSQKCAHKKYVETDFTDCCIVNSHKMYGPKSMAGALVNKKFLDSLQPSVFGGGMVEHVGFPNTWKSGVLKYEAGSIDVANCIGWMEACKFIENYGFDRLIAEEQNNCTVIINELKKIEGISIFSDEKSTSLISFSHENIHAHDIEAELSKRNVIVRAGHICSQNSIAKNNMTPIVRISFGIGTDSVDIDMLMAALRGCLD